MNKVVQKILYVLSLLIVIGVLAALVTSGGESGTNDAIGSSTETMEEIGNSTTVGTDTVSKKESGGDTEVDVGAESSENVVTESDMATETTETEDTKLPEESGEATTIIFTGDVLFANAFKAGYDANGIAGVISEELLAELQSADVLMVNNEFPFSEQGEPMAGKQYTFRCEPSYVTALSEMGVDIVSLANNHTLDYGKEALEDTFRTLDDAGILYGGAGENVDRAQEVQIIEVNGKKFGFIAVSRVIPTADWKVENSAPGIFSCYDESGLVELVAAAKEVCDYVAVYPHWGVEYEAYPESYQTKIAEKCLAAGADVIVGSHTHCLQGAAFIDEKPVFYSLGNFVFGQNIDRSAILKVTVETDGTASYQYLPVYAAGGVTHLATGEQAEQICRYLGQISTDAVVESDGTVTEKN